MSYRIRLKSNSRLHRLYLDNNQIGESGAAALGEALKTNSTLQSLFLKRNNIGDGGAEVLGEALKHNRTLHALFLSSSQIGDCGASALGEALKTNSTLHALILDSNQIGDCGAAALGEALKTNSALQTLHLGANKICHSGAAALAVALKANSTLTTLDLYSNEIGDNAAAAFGDSLNVNFVLSDLWLGINDKLLESDIDAKLERNCLHPPEVIAALENGGTAPWGRVKLMLVGQGAAGKTSTLRSLLGMRPVADHHSTEVADVHLTRSEDWVQLAPNESDLARQAVKVAVNNYNSRLPQDVAKGKLTRQQRKSHHPTDHSMTQEASKDRQGPPASQVFRPLMSEEEAIKRYSPSELRSMQAKAKKGDSISFSIWDYGGQEVFYALHHIFLTQNGIYLVVFNMREWLDDRAKAERFLRFWLNSIELHAPCAPVILVGTHADRVIEDADRARISRDLCGIVKEVGVSHLASWGANSMPFIPINNLDASPARASPLRTVVETTASSLPSVKRMVPLAWLRAVDLMIEPKRRYLSYDQVAAICKALRMHKQNSEDTDDTEEMLAFLHELGVVVHHRATEELHSRVIVDPQWLVDNLACVIGDELHYQKRLDAAGPRFADLQRLYESGIATRALLEHLWGPENTDFLIAFMEQAMLLCRVGSATSSDPNQRHYLATSLVARDEVLDMSNFESGLACVLHFPKFLPDGVFQRLVSTCAAQREVTKHKISRRDAKVSVPGGYVAFKWRGPEILILLHNEESQGPLQIKRVVSMFREAHATVFPRLEWRLLLVSPTDSTLRVAYADAAYAHENNLENVEVEGDGEDLTPLSIFAPFFSDALGPLDSDELGTIFHTNTNLLPLGCTRHVFISHYQHNAGDTARVLAMQLERRGLAVWIDQNQNGNLSEDEMRRGIDESKVYLLLLTKDVLSRPAVLMELKHAITTGKPIQLVHESQPNLASFCPFGDYINDAPAYAADLFKKNESMPIQRRNYLVEPFLDELTKRIRNR